MYHFQRSFAVENFHNKFANFASIEFKLRQLERWCGPTNQKSETFQHSWGKVFKKQEKLSEKIQPSSSVLSSNSKQTKLIHSVFQRCLIHSLSNPISCFSFSSLLSDSPVQVLPFLQWWRPRYRYFSYFFLTQLADATLHRAVFCFLISRIMAVPSPLVLFSSCHHRCPANLSLFRFLVDLVFKFIQNQERQIMHCAQTMKCFQTTPDYEVRELV